MLFMHILNAYCAQALSLRAVCIVRNVGLPTCLPAGRESNSVFTSITPLLSNSFLVGLPRIELGSYPPHGHILPLYYSPIDYWFCSKIVEMQSLSIKNPFENSKTIDSSPMLAKHRCALQVPTQTLFALGSHFNHAFRMIKMWTQGDSNPSPRPCHGRALPDELWAHAGIRENTIFFGQMPSVLS